MTIEETIAQTLKSWPALSKIVIRPDKVEQGDIAPYITYQKFWGARVQSLTGDSGLSNTHFQFDVYASTRLAAANIKNEVRKALFSSSVLGAVHLSEGAGFDEPSKTYRERIDFSFWFSD